MSKLSEKINADINLILNETSINNLDKLFLEDLVKKLVDIAIKIETNQADIESSGKEFQNYLYEKKQ
ncbi:MAG: hypothetical protein H6540_07675 [Bacteroidales bacterium]|nr:hypothetical protein [Bacteroidales bacterium]